MPVRWETVTFERQEGSADGTFWLTRPRRGWDLDTVRHGTLVALCTRRGASDHGDSTCQDAQGVLEHFYYQPHRDNNVERALVDSVAQALFTTKYYSADEPAEDGPDGQSAANATDRSTGETGAAGDGDELDLIAAAIYRGILHVAHSGHFRTCVWRNGDLIMLEVNPPTVSPLGYARFELVPMDRVLMCSESVLQQIPPDRIADILRRKQAPGSAAMALLTVATSSRPTTPVSAAVIDYHPALHSVMPSRAGVVRASATAVLGALALLLWRNLPIIESARAPATAVILPALAAPVTEVPVATLVPRPVATSTPSVSPTPEQAHAPEPVQEMTPTGALGTSTPDTTPTLRPPVLDALHPQRVVPTESAAPLTLTVKIDLESPAAYILYARQGQMLDVRVSPEAYAQVLDAHGQSLTFPGQSVQLPIRADGDYVVVTRGAGAVNVVIGLWSP